VTRTPFLTLLFTLTALLAAVIAAPAEAAKRKVPFGFFGTVLTDVSANLGQVSDQALEQQMDLMARSGVESVRVPLAWLNIEPAPGVYDWTASDRLVAAAARHRLELLGNVMWTPRWASEQPNDVYFQRYEPTDPQLYAQFVRELILRYGPRGSFWAQQPGVPRVPVREWQLWNEQMAPWFWSTQPWPYAYTRMLKAAYPVIHRADRGANVVAGSLVSVGPYTQWFGMRDMYRAGAKRFFDVVSVHPFTNNQSSLSDTMWRTLEIVRRVRRQMRRYGDSRKPVIITELSWPAAIGRVPQNRLLGLETTPRGQVLRLTASYRALAREQHRLRITQADWFAWATAYDANSPQSDVSYRFAGLTRQVGGVFSPMPILKTYAKVAAEQEGCRKSSSARKCR
jgi:hypothetical protein